MCGTPELDFLELEKVTVYEGFTRSHPTVKAFWNVVHSLTPDLKRRMLLFVTGCAKVGNWWLRQPFFLRSSGVLACRAPFVLLLVACQIYVIL